jgi:rhodanese-related sulfurtransferase
MRSSLVYAGQLKLGYKNVKVFHDGLPEWKKAGNIMITTMQYIKDNLDKDCPMVLVDVRSPEEVKKGHIPGAVSIAPDKLNNARTQFPMELKAPIIVYGSGADDQVPSDAAKTIASWKCKNVTILPGGMSKWQAAGYPMNTGVAKTEIVYVRKLLPGEISIPEFKKIVEQRPEGVFLIDVRLRSDAQRGMIRGAVNIPLDEISTRMKEISKDKDIVLYCGVGLMSEMAYNVLKDAGYKARYLNALVTVNKDGNYKISE